MKSTLMLEIRKFCYSSCTNNNYGPQRCHRCCCQSSHLHCQFDCASSGLVEDNNRESAETTPWKFDGSCWKNWLVVAKIQFQTFWRDYCIIVLVTIKCYQDSTTKWWFFVKSAIVKNTNICQKCYSLFTLFGPNKSQPYANMPEQSLCHSQWVCQCLRHC